MNKLIQKLTMMSICLMMTMGLQINAQENLVYGKTYHLQNGWNNHGGGYLDVNGQGCQDNYLCVSTSKDLRDGTSNEWIIVSTTGKQDGEAVANNDIIQLKSAWNGNGGYLGIRGYGMYYPENPGHVCVSTWKEAQTDGATSWKVSGASSDGYVKDFGDISLENQWSGGRTYLDTRGYDNKGFLSVSGSQEMNRDGGSGNWKIMPTVYSRVGTSVSISACDAPLGTYYYDSEKSTMSQGDRIYTGQVLSSDNGNYFALMTDDGRFTMNKVTSHEFCAGGIKVYITYDEVWSADTGGRTAGDGGYVELQEDGHLCMYTKDAGYIWCGPYSKGSVKVDIDEQNGCLKAWDNHSLKWSSCK